VTEQSAETYAATFDTNVLGTPLGMKHQLRVMLAQDLGSIVTSPPATAMKVPPVSLMPGSERGWR
jgi:NADP-dependent 3-hydroxy acid dehydrogenase YdfG